MLLFLHQINQWYCKGALVCQSLNCQSLMSSWFYRVGFEISSCFSCKIANDSHDHIVETMCKYTVFCSSSQFLYIFVHHAFSWLLFLFVTRTFTPSSCSSSTVVQTTCAANISAPKHVSFFWYLYFSIWSSNFHFYSMLKNC